MIKSTTGAGTHLSPRPAIPAFGVSTSNDITDEDGSGFKTAASSSFIPQRNGVQGNRESGGFDSNKPNLNAAGSSSNSGSYGGSNSPAGNPFDGGNNKISGFGSGSSGGSNSGKIGSSLGSSGNRQVGAGSYGGNDNRRGGSPGVSQGSNKGFGAANADNYENSDDDDIRHRERDPLHSGGVGSLSIGSKPQSHSGNNLGQSGGKGNRRPGDRGSARYPGGNKHQQSSNEPPYVTNNHGDLDDDRDQDWRGGNRDSTIVKNVGNWYVGLPPGAAVRAHVQNIDLLPLGGRPAPSPGDALRRDEQRSLQYDNYD